MVTAAALQARLPFVCSASCTTEVINAIIRYAGRVSVCASVVTHAWSSLWRKRAETQNVGGRLTWTRLGWVFCGRLLLTLGSLVVFNCCGSWLKRFHFVSLLNLTSNQQNIWHRVGDTGFIILCRSDSKMRRSLSLCVVSAELQSDLDALSLEQKWRKYWIFCFSKSTNTTL